MNDSPIAFLLRDGIQDCVHRGHIVVVDKYGSIIFSIGNPDEVVLLRSLAKPIQASIVVKSGAFDSFDFLPEELALMAASHSGNQEHITLLERMVAKLGLRPENLQCGVVAPLGYSILGQQTEFHNSWTTLHSDCSGKHIGMLAVCLHYGWDVHSYIDRMHPIQQLCLTTLAELVEESSANIQIATDGCGIPTYALKLKQTADIFCQLGSAASNHAPNDLARVADAMMSFPRYVAGPGRFTTELMKATNGKLIAKDGAEGIYAIACPQQELGLVIKVSDGNRRAAIPVVPDVLLRLNIIDETEAATFLDKVSPHILNNHGKTVGHLVSAIN